MTDIFFGSSLHINRYSYLRRNKQFISRLIESQTSKLLIFRKNSINKRFEVLGNPTKTNLKLISQRDNAVFDTELKKWDSFNKKIKSEILSSEFNSNSIKIIWLGIDTNNINHNSTIGVSDHISGGDSSLQFNDTIENVKGTPIFAIDITNSINLQKNIPDEFKYIQKVDEIILLPNYEATLFSYANMYMDWIFKHKFCTSCGGNNVARDAGTRLECMNNSPYQDQVCDVGSNNNVSFPRVDPVVIIALKNEENEILLGHNKRRHDKSKNVKKYSCFSGFMEPGETIEECCVREVYEETGIVIESSNIKIIESQPWPFPANLMVGCVGLVKGNQKINVNLDDELEDCRWFARNDVEKWIDNKNRDSVNWSIPSSESIAGRIISRLVKESKL